MILDQTTSNHFKLTNSHSLHTLVTEREFNYGICKLYCVGMWFEDLSQDSCNLGCNDGAEHNLFLFLSFI